MTAVQREVKNVREGQNTTTDVSQNREAKRREEGKRKWKQTKISVYKKRF